MNLTDLAQSLKDGGHSIFSPSGSSLWLNCSGGLLANLMAPDTSGVDAAEGTVAHGVGELWLRTKKKPRHLIGTVEKIVNAGVEYEIEITDVMLDHCQVYFDWCAWLPGQHFIETKVYFDAIMPIPHQGGTADHVACSWQVMTITDFKYGKGHAVHAKDNTQALLYALGFFYEYDWLYDFQTIVIRICQPRMEIQEEWTITRAELLEWAEYAKARAELAWDYDAPRTAGVKQCQFCRVKATCGAHIQLQEDLVGFAFEDIGKPMTVAKMEDLAERIDAGTIFRHTHVFDLTTDQMARLIDYRGFVESWWKALHNELTRRALAGTVIPGKKLVLSRTHRQFESIPKTVAALAEYGVERDEIVSEQIESPAEVERILRKHGVPKKDLPEVLKPLVYKPAGKATLVSIADKRAAIEDTSEVFADLETETPETEEL